MLVGSACIGSPRPSAAAAASFASHTSVFLAGPSEPLPALLVNPFRQPALQSSHGNALPAMSNAFLMVLAPSSGRPMNK